MEKVLSGAYLKINLAKKQCEKKAGRYPIQILRFPHKVSGVFSARELTERDQILILGFQVNKALT